MATRKPATARLKSSPRKSVGKPSATAKRAGPTPADPDLIASGIEPFTIASRIVREFGERLVKQPEVALLELVKNAYDADANECTISYAYPHSITVKDDGHGMTREEFLGGWMRIGTGSKNKAASSRLYQRPVSGEKGIGRFAVSYLGRHLVLRTVAVDAKYGRTELTATFDWPQFDRETDLGVVRVPYELRRVAPGTPTGTTLIATDLRAAAAKIEFRQISTGSLGLLSAYRSLLRRSKDDEAEGLPTAPAEERHKQDTGFDLRIEGVDDEGHTDVAKAVLDNYVFRAVVSVERSRLQLRVYRRGELRPVLKIDDRYAGKQGRVYADVRFFPRRAGTFAAMPADGRAVTTWVRENAGVAVFDRNFRVLPYGTLGDDWLELSADAARNQRAPRSSLAQRHLAMEPSIQGSTQLNYMLRLPLNSQVVGAVQVFGTRSQDQVSHETSLIATADRQGFIQNQAFDDLWDVVRGALEAIAFSDREWQQEMDRIEIETQAATAQAQTQEAIAQVRANPSLTTADKKSLVNKLTAAQMAMRKSDDLEKTREASLEVMSLLGVVAGFMTHEFGTALEELRQAKAVIEEHAKRDRALVAVASSLATRIRTLSEFVEYSQGYIRGTSITPVDPVPVKPRIRQVLRYFGRYAADRKIEVQVDVDPSLLMPPVPLSLYGGIVLNLYTNALKAVIARSTQERNAIWISARTEKGRHRLLVADTGVGIPSALTERIFDPLFTTTESERDPMRSGMGLGLTLVRRAARAFHGTVRLIRPPQGYITCFEVTFPVKDDA